MVRVTVGDSTRSEQSSSTDYRKLSSSLLIRELEARGLKDCVERMTAQNETFAQMLSSDEVLRIVDLPASILLAVMEFLQPVPARDSLLKLLTPVCVVPRSVLASSSAAQAASDLISPLIQSDQHHSFVVVLYDDATGTSGINAEALHRLNDWVREAGGRLEGLQPSDLASFSEQGTTIAAYEAEELLRTHNQSHRSVLEQNQAFAGYRIHQRYALRLPNTTTPDTAVENPVIGQAEISDLLRTTHLVKELWGVDSTSTAMRWELSEASRSGSKLPYSAVRIMRHVAAARLLLPKGVSVVVPASLFTLKLAHLMLHYGANELGYAGLDETACTTLSLLPYTELLQELREETGKRR